MPVPLVQSSFFPFYVLVFTLLVGGPDSGGIHYRYAHSAGVHNRSTGRHARKVSTKHITLRACSIPFVATGSAPRITKTLPAYLLALVQMSSKDDSHLQPQPHNCLPLPSVHLSRSYPPVSLLHDKRHGIWINSIQLPPSLCSRSFCWGLFVTVGFEAWPQRKRALGWSRRSCLEGRHEVEAGGRAVFLVKTLFLKRFYWYCQNQALVYMYSK